jgi:hypothetical protein
MAEPTITAVFGAGASQTATTITITKSDLVSTGLTASASNTAESLLAAIVLKAKEALTQTAFTTNIDQSITVEPGFNSIVQRAGTNGVAVEYRQFQYNIGFHKLDNLVLDPDDL